MNNNDISQTGPRTGKQLQKQNQLSEQFAAYYGDYHNWDQYARLRNKGCSREQISQMYQDYTFRETFGKQKDYDNIVKKMSPKQRLETLVSYGNQRSFEQRVSNLNTDIQLAALNGKTEALNQSSNFNVTVDPWSPVNTKDVFDFMRPELVKARITKEDVAAKVQDNQPLSADETEVYNKYLEEEAAKIFPYVSEKDILNNPELAISYAGNIASDLSESLIGNPLMLFGAGYKITKQGTSKNTLTETVDEVNAEINKRRSEFILKRMIIPYNQNDFAYGSLTLDNFKDIVYQLVPYYDKYGGSKWASNEKINYEALYEQLKDKVAAGKVGEVTDYLQKHIENILGKNQAGWFESGDDLLPSKREVFFRSMAGKTVESLINSVTAAPSFAQGIGESLFGNNFWEAQSFLPNVAHDLYESIKGENSVVFSDDTFSDWIAKNGETFGAFTALGIEMAITRKAAGKFRNPAKGKKFQNITSTYLAIESGLDEAYSDALELRDNTIKKGEEIKNSYINNKYREFLQEFTATRPYDAYKAEQIYQDLYEEASASNEQFDPEILQRAAIAQAQAEQWFAENNQDYDEYVRHQANTAYGRTLIEEAAVVSASTLLGLGVEARLVPSRLMKPMSLPFLKYLPESANKLETKLVQSGKFGKAIAFTGKTAGKGAWSTLTEIPEELGQEHINIFQQKRAEKNIENYAKGLYFGFGADMLTAQELGFLQGIMDIGPEAWKEVDKEDITKSVASTTLLLGGFHGPGTGKSREQIRLDNDSKIGQIFDYIRKYSPYHSILGDVAEEVKAEMYEKPYIVQKGFEHFYNDAKVTEVRQSIAAAVNIGAQMVKAAEEGNVEEYQKQQGAYQASLAIMLDTLNKNNPKYAKQFIELLQNRASAKNLNQEKQDNILQQWLEDASTNDMKNVSREEQLDFMTSSSQEVLDLMKEAESIRKKYEEIGIDKQTDVRPLIFAELLNNLAPKVINENWKQLSVAVDKVLADNATNEKFKSLAYQYIINNYLKEADFNSRLDALIDISKGNVEGVKKEDLIEAFNDISNKLSMEVPNTNSIIKSDVNLTKWRDSIYREWNKNFDTVLKGEGLISEEEFNKTYKSLTTDKYKKEVGKEIYRRRKSVNDLVRYIDSLQSNVDAEKHEDDRHELFKELEEKDPNSYKNLTKALEILQTAENIKDVLKETSLKNKDIQKIYNTLEQAIDLAKLNVENASDLLNIGTYATIISDPSGVTQGYLTDILSDINQQSEIPTVDIPNEENPKKSNSSVTKNRIKQHRKEKRDVRKTEEAVLKEKEIIDRKYANFSITVKEFIEEFKSTKTPSIDKLQDWLQYTQQLIKIVNSREYATYISRNFLENDLEILQALEDNIINELAKAIHEEQTSAETKEKINSEITKHTEKIQAKQEQKTENKTSKQINKIKKLKLSDFREMQERIAFLFNEFSNQNVTYDMIMRHIWNDHRISNIVKEVFGTIENMKIFYETVKDFGNYYIKDIKDARYIVNQVVLANLLNIDAQLLQTSDILDRLTAQKLKEVFGHGNVKKQHQEAINIVLEERSEYYNETIAARHQLYEKIKEAYDNHKQIVLQEAPDDCKITVKVNGKKVPLIISKAQAEKEDNKNRQVDNSLLFKDEQSNRELPIDTASRIDYTGLSNEALGFLSGAESVTQVKNAIYEDAFQYIYDKVQDEIEKNVVGQTVILDENKPELSNEDDILEAIYEDYLKSERIAHHPIVIELDGKFLPYYTTNNNYKSGEIITIKTEDGVKAATILYYGLPEDNSDFNTKATSLDNIVIKSKPILSTTNKKINATVIRPAIREDNKTISKEAYKEVQDRIDYSWANDGNVHVGDNVGFVVYTWNSPEGPRRVIYYTTEKQEDGSYHILEVLDQGSYAKQINPNSPIGKLISRIREADTGIDGFYYQEEGWQVNKVTYNHANPTNNKLSFEEGNLNKILDEDNGVFGVKTDGKVNRVILIKQDRTGFVSTDKNFTQDTLLNSNPNSERDKSTRVASNKEGAAMRENLPFIVMPTTDGYEALLLTNFVGPSVEGYMDIIKRSLLEGKIGEMFKNDILQRITDLFRNTRIRGVVEKPASVSLAKFFKTNNQALVISSNNANTFSIYITSPDGTGGVTSTLLATINYPADINNASKEDKTTKDLITSSQLEVLNGATGTISTTNFDDIYKAIVNRITSETNPVINSVNINFEQIQDNPTILDSLIADGLLWSSYAPLNSNGKIKRTGAQVEAVNTTESKKIALVNFEADGPVFGYNIDGLDVQLGDNVESKFGGNQGRVIATMTTTEYDQYRKDNNLTDKWTSEEVLKQPQSKFIDRHTKITTPAPIITASTTEYTSNISNEESVRGDIPKPIQAIRKKKTGATKSTQSTPHQTREVVQQDSVDTLPSSEVVQENIFKPYDQITDEGLLERLDEVGVTEELWNKLDPFARERLITCGKW